MKTLLTVLAALLMTPTFLHASDTMTNGSFETMGVQYSPALGGIYEAHGWTNLSGLNIQAASVPSGSEGTPATANGTRILRLVTDNGDMIPANVGCIAQYLGTMVGGATYSFTADAFGGAGASLNWGATAAFVNTGTANPSAVYATQMVSGVGAGVFVANAFALSYTARPADDGQYLWIWLKAIPAGSGQSTRGGLDNCKVSVTTAGSGKDLSAFSFGVLGNATISETNIAMTVPNGTDVAALAPTFTMSPFATANPASGTRRDFTTPQTYVITAKDTSQKTHVVTVHVAPPSFMVDNGMVAVEIIPGNGAITMTFKARSADGTWREVCRSFTPDFAAHPRGNRFFDTTVTPRRYQMSEIVSDYTVVQKRPERTVLRLWGNRGKTYVEETVSLQRDDPYVHVDVHAELDEPKLDYLIQSFTFNATNQPEFIHTPTAKMDDGRSGPGRDQVIGDHAFHAPAIILQEGGLFTALVPDLDAINKYRIVSPDARRRQQVGRNQFSVPIEDDKYTMPTGLDLNIVSDLTEKPVLSYGMMDFVVGHHIRYQRVNDASMIRTLNTTTVRFGFDLFLGAKTAPCRGYQQVSRHIWRKYGHPLFEQSKLPMTFDEYVKTIYGVVSKPMDPGIQAPVPGYEDHGVFLDFELNGQPVGGMVAPVIFNDALWNFEFWNNVRDASGMYYWGKKQNNPELVDRARRIVNLALCAPTNEAGFFSLVYLAKTKEWLRSTVGPSPHPNNIFSRNDCVYNVPAMSKTAAHLLEYFQHCEPDPRIPAYLRSYANSLLARIDERGIIPSYYTPDMQAIDDLTFSAQPAATMWFLAEMANVSGDKKYLDGAKRIATFMMREILPKQRWIDLEPYYSCGRNPLSFLADKEQGLPIRGNLSTSWAARGFAALYRASREKIYLDAGEAVVDYLAFSQASWSPHYIYTAFPFGGFTADNIDTATWLDARQCEMAAPFIWYGQTLNRKDLVERGIAAARSSVVLINHPLHKEGGIYRHTNFYGFGLGPENINHEGHNQSAMRTHPGWGECSGIFTGLADADRMTQNPPGH